MCVLCCVLMPLQTMAPTWVTREGSDGLTTNGVVVMHPQGYFEPGVMGGEWQEVTVMGNMHKLRTKRSSRTPGEPVSGGSDPARGSWQRCKPLLIECRESLQVPSVTQWHLISPSTSFSSQVRPTF